MRTILQFVAQHGMSLQLPPSFICRAMTESFGSVVAHIEYDTMQPAATYVLHDIPGGQVPDNALYVGSVAQLIPHCPPIVHHFYAVPV